MLGWLARRARPAWRTPLRGADWDGATLTLRFDAGAAGTVALDLDGAFFTEADVGADGWARFAFPFAPGGTRMAAALPRAARDGEPLADTPLRLAFGRPGLARAGGDANPLAALAPPHAGPLPFGVEADAEVAIVVPVYGAPALVERCLDAVLAETTGRARLIVVDDASPDPAIAPLLERYAALGGVELLRNATNRGFTASANRGIAAAGRADVVLLNADAEVGPNWLTGLRRAAYSSADVGTATAVSDDAGAFSVPELERTNALPAAWTFAQSARALWQHAGLAYPELPTGNGFCLYIRRAALDAAGALDEAAFPQGYGEENDFCQRAAHAGFRHRIAGNVLVRHARSASFGAERRRALGEAGMAVLRARWPDYEAEVGRTLRSFERRVLDWRVRRTFAAASAADAPRPRVLVAGARGATLPPRFEPWRVEARGGELVLLTGRAPVAHADRADAEPALWSWLQLHAIEAVVAPAAGDAVPAALPRLAAALGLAVAASADGLDAAAAGLLCFAARRTR